MMQPAAPQGAPEQAQAQGSGPTQLISGLQSDMKKLGALLEKSGAGGPEAMEEYAALIQAFEGFIEKLMGGGGEKAPAPSGAASVEAGANPNARPV